MQTRFLLIVFHALPLLSVCQTCIVAVKSKDKIVIGADSRSALPIIGDSKGPETYTDTACKIISNGQFGIAYIGHVGPLCAAAAKEALYTFTSLDQIENTFFAKSNTSMQKYVDTMLLSNDPSAKKYVEEQYPTAPNRYIGAVFIFGYQSDSIVFETWYLQRFVSIDGLFHANWRPAKGDDTVAFGDVTELDASGLLHNKSTWVKGVVPGIITAINYAHNQHPTHVGGPIDIIEFTHKKSKWLQKKPICN